MKDPLYDQSSLVFRFKKQAEAQGLFKKNQKLLIACSGGPDSVALFHLIRLAFPQMPAALAHFNHRLRKTAGRDEKFVHQLARSYRADLFTEAAKNLRGRKGKQSLEEAARMQRYAFLKKAFKASRAKMVLLAHHQDDQAETVLMRLCQGTGMRGLLGIRSKLEWNGMPAARPLLGFSKEELLSFLKEHDFAFCEDESNLSEKHLRNRFRLKVLPFLKKNVNPRVSAALARIPDILEEEQDLILQLEQEALRRVFLKATPRLCILKAAVFNKLHPAVRFRVLDAALKKMDPASGLLSENWRLIRGRLAEKGFQFSLPRDIELLSQGSRLTLRRKP